VFPGKWVAKLFSIAACPCQYHNLVRSILRNPVKGVNEFRMILRCEGQRTALGVELGNQDAIGRSGQLQTAVSGKIVALSSLHSNPPEEMGVTPMTKDTWMR
jgi:hypothetical protein